ncbi:MAG: hypothetical protein ACNYNX_00735 [Leucobacter sp.]
MSSPKLLPVLSLISGAVSLVLLVVFVATMAGQGVWIASLVLGVVALVLGVVALVKRHAKGFAIAGVALGAVSVLSSAGLLVFALIFVGAIPV